MEKKSLKTAIPIAFRPFQSEDESFLYTLYASTRQAEMEMTGWSNVEKETFLRMQFTAQLTHYQTHFPDADHNIIILDKSKNGRNLQPIGRVYLDRRPDELRLLDIALLPEHRNSGIGTAYMQSLLNEGATVNKRVTLTVYENNHAAYRFYQRFGFSEVNRESVYIFMEWLPQTQNSH